MLQSYLEELRKTKLLEPQQEILLWQRAAAGDAAAHREIITAYQPLVFKIAVSFKLPESETMELIQEGTIGLLEAAEHYDYRRKVAFSLFAAFRIKGSMLDYLKKNSGGETLSLEGEIAGVALAETLAATGVSPTEAAENRFLREKVTQALARLPEKEQSVLKGIFMEDKSAQAVADSIHVSLGHVYRLQKQGVRRIRGMLSRLMHDLKN